MRPFRTILGAAAVAVATSPTAADRPSPEAAIILQAAINAEGESCPQVTDAQPLGISTNDDAIVAVSCSDGGRHVVRIRPDDSVGYVSSCTVWAATSGQSC